MFLFVIRVMFFVFPVILFVKLLFFIKRFAWKRRAKDTVSVGFFHPYCNAGGGGERVLWEAIRAVQKEYKNIHCVVYSGDNVSAEDIIKNVELRFNIKLHRGIQFEYLRCRFLVEAKYYPFCTLLLQSLGSVVLAFEALSKHVPDIYIDTMGYAFTFPIFRFFGSSRICAYVHFPTISTDMLKVVKNRQVGVNNRRFISNNKIFSECKLVYYKIFAFLYGFVGRRAEVIMVNSSWTRGHILELWKKPQRTFTVYPPCDVSQFNNIPLESHNGKSRFLSIAQFRPEKDHQLQIRAFHQFISELELGTNPVKNNGPLPTLVLVGSCRDEGDSRRVDGLKNLCENLGILKNVEFKVNLSFRDVMKEMENASVALHTMRDEHFGIGIVECMSAGLVMIAHDSGGPKMDIVVDFNEKKTGFLATDIQSFADAMTNVWNMKETDLYEIRKCARESVSRFSVNKFEETFLQSFRLLFL
ncbi:hypothetical protein JTE90_003044 [Oedothorax gibbosus]|uniref:GDP-Man:Man(3)GlcNAc(2)-PP-Dol alpha-1,2-mannosyltransferase n=1 Tax=Oedothorax gibbosus TaxID=931172 RepID=A0AAV6VEN8_9ARAC|nr:hypothetical protein JTE90_003044 [Oedothorax gibbosus]